MTAHGRVWLATLVMGLVLFPAALRADSGGDRAGTLAWTKQNAEEAGNWMDGTHPSAVGAGLYHGWFPFSGSPRARLTARLPRRIKLIGNHPNPFNPYTTIAFEARAHLPVRLEIYALSGKRIVTLISQTVSPGRHYVSWDGRDADGARVASGIYLLRLESGSQNESLIVTLLK